MARPRGAFRWGFASRWCPLFPKYPRKRSRRMSVREKGRNYMGDFTVAGIRYRQVFSSHAAAEAWEFQSRANLKLGKAVERKQVSRAANGPDTIRGLFNHVVKVYWADLAPAAAEKRDAQRFVDFVGASASPETAFSVEKLGEFAADLKAIGCSNGTINRHLSNVSKMARVALKASKIGKMPNIAQQKETPRRAAAFKKGAPTSAGPKFASSPGVAASSLIRMVAAAAKAGDETGERLFQALRNNQALLSEARPWWTRSMIDGEAVSIAFMKTHAAEEPRAGTDREPKRPA